MLFKRQLQINFNKLYIPFYSHYFVMERDKLITISFITLLVGIILDGILFIFFSLSLVSLILISLHRRDIFRLFFGAMLIGFSFEELGIHTGIPFGHYAYNFPPYILGVPIFVILAWGIISYISYLPLMDFPLKYKVIFFPLMMVIIDMSVDPIMVTAHYWTWYSSGLEWYGIPVTNFLGWYIVSLVISLSFLKSSQYTTKEFRFIITYFLFSLKFLIFAKPQLFVPLLEATTLAGVISLVLYVIEKRIGENLH